MVQGATPLLVDTTPLILTIALVFAVEMVSRIDRQTVSLLVQGLKLKRTDTLMRNIVANTFDGILTVREDGGIETANAAAREIFGYPEDSMTGEHIATLFPEIARRVGGSQRPRRRQDQRHPHRRRLQLPPCPQMAEAFVCPNPGRAPQRHLAPHRKPNRRFSLKSGFFTDDYVPRSPRFSLLLSSARPPGWQDDTSVVCDQATVAREIIGT